MSRKLRVVTLTDQLVYSGGAERLSGLLTRGLDERFFERSIWTTRPARGLLVDELRADGIPIRSLDRRSAKDLAAWRPLVRALRSERVDVLHAHQFSSNVWGTLVGRLARVPVVVAHEHGWAYEGEPLRRFLDGRLIGRGASAFVAVSTADRARMLSVEHVPEAKARFVPNGIPPLPASTRDVRPELGIPPDAPLVGTISVLRREKGLDAFLRAAALLRREHPDLRVLVAGTGPERDSLEALVGELGLEGHAFLLGARPDVPDLLAALDVAVNSSHREASPLSVMEYMAAGKAIVASRVGGIPDLIEDGVQGLLVEPADPEAIAAGVDRLLRDPALRAELGARARERQAAELTLDATVRRLEELYWELFARTRRARREGWQRPER